MGSWAWECEWGGGAMRPEARRLKRRARRNNGIHSIGYLMNGRRGKSALNQ